MNKELYYEDKTPPWIVPKHVKRGAPLVVRFHPPVSREESRIIDDLGSHKSYPDPRRSDHFYVRFGRRSVEAWRRLAAIWWPEAERGTGNR